MLLYFFYAGLIVLTGSALKIIIRRFDKNEIRVTNHYFKQLNLFDVRHCIFVLNRRYLFSKYLFDTKKKNKKQINYCVTKLHYKNNNITN